MIIEAVASTTLLWSRREPPTIAGDGPPAFEGRHKATTTHSPSHFALCILHFSDFTNLQLFVIYVSSCGISVPSFEGRWREKS